MGKTRSPKDRVAGPFVALPHAVIDSQGYRSLGYAARALLVEIARQYRGDNNGRLLASRAYMLDRGWNSSDVLSRAKADLLKAGLIHETVKGRRPNKASWYACTWWKLDRHPGYDEGGAESFVRGTYGPPVEALKPAKPSREELYARWNGNTTPCPDPGLDGGSTGPDSGQLSAPVGPDSGPVRHVRRGLPSPAHGHHLEMPSAGGEHRARHSVREGSDHSECHRPGDEGSAQCVTLAGPNRSPATRRQGGRDTGGP
jgi:hypothetical protein